MEINPVQYLELTFYNNPDENEISVLSDVIKKCVKESIKPGFKNMFTEPERDLLIKVASKMGMEIAGISHVVIAGDTHTVEKQ